jgi:putative RNA 2'-phosphotransferase
MPTCHNLIDLCLISKRLSYWLRHHPEDIGIVLEKNGWTPLDILIQKAVDKGFLISQELIEKTVESSDKQRFSICDGKIRANQGHSVDIEIHFFKQTPPDILFHGTAFKVKNNIFKEGLLKMKRHHVHLSDEYGTAVKVGKRHGKPLVLEIDAKRMAKDGIDFFKSVNGVWLVESVHPRYILSTQ